LFIIYYFTLNKEDDGSQAVLPTSEAIKTDMTVQFSLRGGGRQLSDSTESEVDYWRKRAGWADDDATMTEYNNGVYTHMYGYGDDGVVSSSSSSSSSSSNSSSSSSSWTKTAKEHIAHSTIFLGALASLLLCLFLFRCCCVASKVEKKEKIKKATKSKDKVVEHLEDKHGERRRSRSKSQARSKSRTRSKARSTVSDEYQLMEDGPDGKNSSKRQEKDSGKRHDKDRSDKPEKDSSKRHDKDRGDKPEKDSSKRHDKDRSDKPEKDSSKRHDKDRSDKLEKDSSKRHDKDRGDRNTTGKRHDKDRSRSKSRSRSVEKQQKRLV
jgi:hypothetical protein